MRLPFNLGVVLGLSFALLAITPARGQDTYQILHTYPHDAQAFTQGLIFLDGHLYESTGIKGQSSLRMEDVETGKIDQFQEVPDKYFAEGLTNWGSTLIQLTWQDHVPSSTTARPSTFFILFLIPAKAGASPRTAKASSSPTAPPRSASSIPKPSTSSATSPSRITASPSPSSTSSNTSTAKSTPTSGTPTASPAFLPPPAASSVGST